MHAGDLSFVRLPFVPASNDADVESERIVAALRESIRRLRAGHRLDARRRMVVA